MAISIYEDGLTYTMNFSCVHASKVSTFILQSKDKWFKDCSECGEKVNWSPKLKAWMSESDWKEYRNFGRRAAGFDPE